MTYSRNHRTLQVDADGTILQAGLDAGLRLAFSCQAGGCGTCKSRLLSGEVEMGRNCLTEQERAEGHILLCVSRPRGPVVIEEGGW